MNTADKATLVALERLNELDALTPKGEQWFMNMRTKAVADAMPIAEPVKPEVASNTQVGGDHYSKLGVYQPWQVLAEWMTPAELRGFAKGTVIAYLAREGDKGGDVDIEKSLHTLQLFKQFRKDKK